jgi:hypothetical protein
LHLHGHRPQPNVEHRHGEQREHGCDKMGERRRRRSSGNHQSAQCMDRFAFGLLAVNEYYFRVAKVLSLEVPVMWIVCCKNVVK